MKNLGNKAAKGFTLIELLVVIAIIGILAGLLLPVLKKAQDSANKTTGISNIKQFGLALRIYEDREGQFPPYDGDRFLACLFNTGEVPDIKLFTPKGASQPALTAGDYLGCRLHPGSLRVQELDQSHDRLDQSQRLRHRRRLHRCSHGSLPLRGRDGPGRPLPGRFGQASGRHHHHRCGQWGHDHLENGCRVDLDRKRVVPLLFPIIPGASLKAGPGLLR